PQCPSFGGQAVVRPGAASYPVGSVLGMRWPGDISPVLCGSPLGSTLDVSEGCSGSGCCWLDGGGEVVRRSGSCPGSPLGCGWSLEPGCRGSVVSGAVVSGASARKSVV